MIYITGDTHGEIDFNKLRFYFYNKKITRKDYLIILGDAGIVWHKDYTKQFVKDYEKLGLTIFYIDGNHENFTLLNKFPIIKKNNANVHQISKHIFHILRGEILILNNLKFLCIGGAESIDRYQRIENMSWWKEESITDEDVEKALDSVKKYNNKVDYILTHCAPSKIHEYEFRFGRSKSILELDKIHKAVDCNKWYFGHYHTDEIFDDKFRCFYDDIIEIN